MESVDLRSDHHRPHLTPNTRASSFPSLTLSPPPSSLCPVVIQRGMTALHFAAEGGHLDCVEVLLAHGAGTEAKTTGGGEGEDGFEGFGDHSVSGE